MSATTVNGRRGAAMLVVALASASCEGDAFEGRIDGVAYTLRLPAGARLTKEDDHLRRWEPASGDGLIVVISVVDGGTRVVDGRAEPVPCAPVQPVMGQASETVEGIKRRLSVSVSHCLDHGERAIRCAAWHTRGHFEDGDEQAALATCSSLRPIVGAN